MGCCGPAQQRNKDIDNAKNRTDLITALNKLISLNNKEIADLNSHLKKKTELQSDYLKKFTDEDLTLRIPYLEELNTSYNELIRVLERCTDVSYIF